MQLGTVQTATRTYRYHITPVKFPSEQGALLHVYNLSAADAALRELLWIFVWVGVGTSAAVTAVAWLLTRRLLRPIHALQVAIRAITFLLAMFPPVVVVALTTSSGNEA